MRLAMTLALAMPLVAACGSSTKTAQTAGGVPAVEYPEWVDKGGSAFPGDKAIYGVGAVSGMKGNQAMARTTAANRARAEVSRVMNTYTASLMKDFQESITAGDFSAESNSQLVQQAIKTFSQSVLNGSEIVERWVHPYDGTAYALCRVDINSFMQKIDGQKELSAKVKEQVKRSAAKAFADLDAEEAKRADP